MWLKEWYVIIVERDGKDLFVSGGYVSLSSVLVKDYCRYEVMSGDFNDKIRGKWLLSQLYNGVDGVQERVLVVDKVGISGYFECVGIIEDLCFGQSNLLIVCNVDIQFC